MPPKKIKGAQGGADAEEFKAEENIQLNWTWKKKGTLIYGDSGTKPSELILSMDMVYFLLFVVHDARLPGRYSHQNKERSEVWKGCH